MFSYRRARIIAKQKLGEVTEVVTIQHEKNSSAKTVYAYLDGELVGEYDSITKCAELLGMSRAFVKKCIDNSVKLDNGFLLTFNK